MSAQKKKSEPMPIVWSRMVGNTVEKIDHGFGLELSLPDGKRLFFKWDEELQAAKVRSPDGTLAIRPHSSNVVSITVK